MLGIVDSENAGRHVDGGDEPLEELKRFLEDVDQAGDSLPLNDVAENLTIACVKGPSDSRAN